MEKRKQIEKALKEIGIYTVEDLNNAIRKTKPLDLALMTSREEEQRKAG